MATSRNAATAKNAAASISTVRQPSATRRVDLRSRLAVEARRWSRSSPVDVRRRRGARRVARIASTASGDGRDRRGPAGGSGSSCPRRGRPTVGTITWPSATSGTSTPAPPHATNARSRGRSAPRGTRPASGAPTPGWTTARRAPSDVELVDRVRARSRPTSTSICLAPSLRRHDRLDHVLEEAQDDVVGGMSIGSTTSCGLDDRGRGRDRTPGSARRRVHRASLAELRDRPVGRRGVGVGVHRPRQDLEPVDQPRARAARRTTWRRPRTRCRCGPPACRRTRAGRRNAPASSSASSR